MSINALRIVKQKMPEVKIYVYGSDAPINIDFEVENLGLVCELSELNDLYNKCKVGLCISMSNPSRIPFEFMTAGVVPVDVYRYNNLMDYPSGTIKLAYQSPESIALAITELLNDENELLSRKEEGINFARTRTLEWEMDVFVNNSLLLLENGASSDSSVHSVYAEKPCISNKDQRKEVLEFCEWQTKLSQL